MSTLIIPNDFIYLPMLQSFVLENIKLKNLDKKFSSKLQLVCEEAFVYVLKNSFEEKEKAPVKIKIHIKNSLFILSFFDKGLPFDSSLSKEYKIENFSAQELELFLIKEYSDSVEWINHGSDGKEFRLTFEIPSQDIFTIIKNEKEETSSSKSLEPQDIEIRAFTKSDAIKISRIIYRAYGYTYPNEDMYYPEKILELNQSGELISVVGYDKKTDEVIGHYALERPGLGVIAESGQAVVSPKCRGFGLMKKMRNILEKITKDLELEGIISQPVTSHTFSQQVNESFGSSPCGFSFGLVPQKLSFKQINQTLSQRESCMLYFKSLKQRNRVLHIPQLHSQMIDTIYKNIGLKYSKAKIQKNDKNGIVTSSYSSSWGIGVINVETVGKDNFAQIKEAFYNLLFSLKAEVIFLNITLEDFYIDDLVENIEREKFFFAGIHPSLLNNKDAIRFEYLNGTINDDKIKIYSDKARVLFEYVLREKEKVLS
jgi:anti-sigma regulatory factor (Ser/Thr protein kinase)